MNRILSNKRLYSNRTTGSTGFGVSSLLEKKRGPAGKVSISVGVISLAFLTFILGGLYLFQVNTVATQGIDLKEAETTINELKREHRKMEIKEVELKSMYQIEKSTKDLDLVNADVVSYIELEGPVAMK